MGPRPCVNCQFSFSSQVPLGRPRTLGYISLFRAETLTLLPRSLAVRNYPIRNPLEIGKRDPCEGEEEGGVVRGNGELQAAIRYCTCTLPHFDFFFFFPTLGLYGGSSFPPKQAIYSSYGGNLSLLSCRCQQTLEPWLSHERISALVSHPTLFSTLLSPFTCEGFFLLSSITCFVHKWYVSTQRSGSLSTLPV